MGARLSIDCVQTIVLLVSVTTSSLCLVASAIILTESDTSERRGYGELRIWWIRLTE